MIAVQIYLSPTPGSPAYEELQKKKAAKGLLDEKSNNADGTTIVEDQPEQAGQRVQPKRDKKRKKKNR